MAKEMTDRAPFEKIVASLEAAWNAADGTAYAAPFAEDADFVTVRAEHLRGRTPIGAGHDGIFRSIYAGSTNRNTVESVRMLRDDVALVHVRAELDVPAGPLAGHQSAMFSLVCLREGDDWVIASLHNTMAPPMRKD